MRPRHGLVVGKFYPPHAGHHLLIRAAADLCERVTVVVSSSRRESIPLEERAAWLREEHAGEANVTVVVAEDEHPIDYESDAVWRAHVEIFRAAAAAACPLPVEAVFSSEGYGPELARRLGARHAAVDGPRELAPISGTAVRADPAAHWELLAPATRGGLARRVVLVGAESTGKTTLARELAEALGARGGAFARTRWVAEYGRDHAVRKLAAARAAASLEGRPPPGMEDVAWAEADFAAIAAEQARREDAEARLGGPVLVADTDAFATAVWHERYRGSASPAVEALAAARRPALYLLTHHDDVPFTQDGTRDGERIRAWMTARFAERLRAEGRPYLELRGAREARKAAALAAVDRLLSEWRFVPPKG